MNAREFFFLVAQMRQTQKDYFSTRDPGILKAAIRLENEVDAEIARTKHLLY